MEKVLEISGLCKTYGKFQALNHLDFEINAGECVGLLGSNGAGKSTTIRLITGQMRPTSGHINVLGEDPAREPKKIHPHIGYIPDNQALYEDFSVFNNIEIFAKLFGKGAQETEWIIEQIQLTEKKKEKIKNLSKGLRQRVLIARALVHRPKFILLDEPTTGLDPSSAEAIYGILEGLKKEGTTLLLTTHLMNDVDRLCDKIVFINRGEKVGEGSPRELKRKYSLPTVDVQIKIGDEVRYHSIEKKENWVKELAQMENQGEILSINTHEPKLEDIFIKLVESAH
jgi:ABC-2 type transport system ATP-binding protein